ncbi:GlsB/YeaQ/YmgE family stress response membrane protein [Clostridium algidicarnis]|uniref:GlsB/YeaQ/YmgE family stress response membrane protein n=2 Tax=Clostridium algidicarnis TaxID=37659 RepID=A0ABS6BZ34_9CLOT|nr:GlsB/YeaQ/YmgE family stress response membrane protein [Clostridium algidicarnis]MBB6630399.1 GlsB/YeaQ/YmgE family stress response membrane protein [Clostridium algidicarnis]MBB6696461.1 GlsB/YeaQ/YmgE family stress response membrane protein [Clostridium algidicarnis]MBU3194018.1 GlsB/YeaQ/YmgE family stress response membrane protein [Clostridium algidicarnis]MBU3195879.1 GlsB/YeaQ/YmgE family stress response membrane protein [Clostridium algidicarnis]MBU3202910.1 GlsB/YeaQ/YmgE family str
MGILAWIILGALSGWIASMITGKDSEMGAMANIIVGIIGAFLGGFLFGLIGGKGITGFNIWSLLVSVIGAVILLAIINAIKKK